MARIQQVKIFFQNLKFTLRLEKFLVVQIEKALKNEHFKTNLKILSEILKNKKRQNIQRLRKVHGTSSNFRCVFIFLTSFPGYSYFRTPPPLNNVDDLEKYHRSRRKSVLPNPLHPFVVNQHCSRGERNG